MLEILEQAEELLPNFLNASSNWKSVNIDYHPPRVERLWRQWGQYRIYLHCIHTCRASEALFHPHPWPSAMTILKGTYEMAIGYGTGLEIPPIAALVITGPGTRYEMTDKDAWHYVRPLVGTAMTVMVTGEPWIRESHGSDSPLAPLPRKRVHELLAYFRSKYPPK
ncbi:MAG: hypothetical protein HY422_03110 [Candidatus Komeilibacteria bacterium]|nr:hypothetical protein [Candidatus Komeilibacteria bacterium]